MSTLIEKLEQEVKRLLELKAQEKPRSLGYMFLGHHISATVNAINIVKQHSDWISVDERLPPEEIKLLFKHEDYGIIIGYYREKGEFVTYDTHYNYREPISRFIKWCHIPPSEVQP